MIGGLNEKDDLELVKQSREGDQGAFSVLVSRYKEKAVKMAALIVGNFEDAKDVSQEAFVKAYNALAKFEGKSKFSTWYFSILMNTARDFTRKKSWQMTVKWSDQEKMDNFFEQVRDENAKPMDVMAGKELGKRMTSAISDLPEKQKWVFTLRFMEEMSLKEIAEVTGMQEGTVKANLHFAIQKFKDEMLVSDFSSRKEK